MFEAWVSGGAYATSLPITNFPLLPSDQTNKNTFGMCMETGCGSQFEHSICLFFSQIFA